MVQVHVLAREWRFKSSHPHHNLLKILDPSLGPPARTSVGWACCRLPLRAGAFALVRFL